MLEIIPLVAGQEQNFTLSYNNEDYVFELKFSDYGNYWYANIYKGYDSEGAKIPFLAGQSLLVNTNVFIGKEYLGLGGLALVDTEPDSSLILDAKNDLGKRLQLYRNL